MKTLSLCMIVKDEEESLPKCLNSVGGLFDQIVIVDTGSSDKTKEIAREFGAEVFDFVWVNDFSKARNYAFSKAKCDYIMWLDADDVIEVEELKKLFELKEKLLAQDVIMLNYAISFDENGKPTFIYERERIFKRSKNYVWQGFIHEAIAPSGNIEHSNIFISHKKIKAGDPKRNLKIYREHYKNGENFSPRDLYYYGKELYYNRKYKQAIKILKKSIVGGWLPNILDAQRTISVCYNILGNNKLALKIMFESLSLAPPEPETCCQIGNIFLGTSDYKNAKYWFVSALFATRQKGSFKNLLYDKFFPYLNLCVCEYRMGNFAEAKKFHELAKEIEPNHPSVLHNEKIFNGV